jgi:hypothetical protein
VPRRLTSSMSRCSATATTRTPGPRRSSPGSRNISVRH